MNSQSYCPAISDEEFSKFQTLIYETAGISLSNDKKKLVSGRLMKRLRYYQISNFDEYYQLVTSAACGAEFHLMIDLLTTNATHFFREQKHFDFLETHILPACNTDRLRVWSAACSNGAEPYSLAMLLADKLGVQSWQLLATDISRRMLAIARKGVYPLEAADKIPARYLERYCLKGAHAQRGVFLIDAPLRNRISFREFNLNGDWNDDWPEQGQFDIIFLRNVMIYFNHDTKNRLVQRIAICLTEGGYLIIGHSESLNGIEHGLALVSHSIYRKQ